MALMSASAPRISDTASFIVPLSGSAESNIAYPEGGTGDPDGSGSVTLTIYPAAKQVCYDFRLSRVSTPLMAHIHQGGALQNGPPIVTLFTGPGGKLDDCVTWLREPLREMLARPSDFYVNLETTEFPDGALRGQLASSRRELR